jgi:hypothetical protein
MVRLIGLVALLGACGDNDDRGGLAADAAAPFDSPPLDAPYQCAPRAALPPACLALAPSTLQGATPFGPLELALDSFASGDCITISAAHIAWSGACGERLRVQFSYPATETGSGRVVTGSFDATARFEFQPPGMAHREHVTSLHVDVTLWREGPDQHDVDITLTVTDPAYSLPPVRISGTFCDWPFWLC